MKDWDKESDGETNAGHDNGDKQESGSDSDR